MKLLILSQYYPPEVGAPQARLSELAVRFVQRGHHVTVLTAMPNYPTGRLFDGYAGRLRVTENRQGVRVVRTWIYASHSPRSLPRLINYLSFAASSLLLGAWRLGAQDVVLVESPPLFLVPSGIVLGRYSRARTVMMVSDIWPDMIVRMGRRADSWSVKALSWLESLAYRSSDVVALTNPGARRQLQERHPGLATTIISNGVDRALFSPEKRSPEIRTALGATDTTFLVGYCGLHGLAQGLDVILDAAERLRSIAHIRFILVGDGPLKAQLVNTAARHGLRNVGFLDARPKSEMPGLVASCDASLVPLTTRLPGTMPSKVYEALASGTPPIVAKGCEAETLVCRNQAGAAFEPMDGEELAAIVRAMACDAHALAAMRVSALRLSERFDRDLITERTEAILTALARNEPLPEVDW